jgi:hypothetical protein
MPDGNTLKPAWGMQEVPEIDPDGWPRLAWGKYRARIEPRTGTDILGREGGFYLHSSDKSQTSGCIETKGNEDIMIRLRDRAVREKDYRILLLVKQ